VVGQEIVGAVGERLQVIASHCQCDRITGRICAHRRAGVVADRDLLRRGRHLEMNIERLGAPQRDLGRLRHDEIRRRRVHRIIAGGKPRERVRSVTSRDGRPCRALGIFDLDPGARNQCARLVSYSPGKRSRLAENCRAEPDQAREKSQPQRSATSHFVIDINHIRSIRAVQSEDSLKKQGCHRTFTFAPMQSIIDRRLAAEC
jgi:hypothetical protein